LNLRISPNSYKAEAPPLAVNYRRFIEKKAQPLATTVKQASSEWRPPESSVKAADIPGVGRDAPAIATQ
jgi:hypothetical protein